MSEPIATLCAVLIEAARCRAFSVPAPNANGAPAACAPPATEMNCAVLAPCTASSSSAVPPVAVTQSPDLSTRSSATWFRTERDACPAPTATDVLDALAQLQQQLCGAPPHAVTALLRPPVRVFLALADLVETPRAGMNEPQRRTLEAGAVQILVELTTSRLLEDAHRQALSCAPGVMRVLQHTLRCLSGLEAAAGTADEQRHRESTRAPCADNVAHRRSGANAASSAAVSCVPPSPSSGPVRSPPSSMAQTVPAEYDATPVAHAGTTPVGSSRLFSVAASSCGNAEWQGGDGSAECLDPLQTEGPVDAATVGSSYRQHRAHCEALAVNALVVLDSIAGARTHDGVDAIVSSSDLLSLLAATMTHRTDRWNLTALALHVVDHLLSAASQPQRLSARSAERVFENILREQALSVALGRVLYQCTLSLAESIAASTVSPTPPVAAHDGTESPSVHQTKGRQLAAANRSAGPRAAVAPPSGPSACVSSVRGDDGRPRRAADGAGGVSKSAMAAAVAEAVEKAAARDEATLPLGERAHLTRAGGSGTQGSNQKAAGESEDTEEEDKEEEEEEDSAGGEADEASSRGAKRDDSPSRDKRRQRREQLRSMRKRFIVGPVHSHSGAAYALTLVLAALVRMLDRLPLYLAKWASEARARGTTTSSSTPSFPWRPAVKAVDPVTWRALRLHCVRCSVRLLRVYPAQLAHGLPVAAGSRPAAGPAAACSGSGCAPTAVGALEDGRSSSPTDGSSLTPQAVALTLQLLYVGRGLLLTRECGPRVRASPDPPVVGMPFPARSVTQLWEESSLRLLLDENFLAMVLDWMHVASAEDVAAAGGGVGSVPHGSDRQPLDIATCSSPVLSQALPFSADVLHQPSNPVSASRTPTLAELAAAVMHLFTEVMECCRANPQARRTVLMFEGSPTRTCLCGGNRVGLAVRDAAGTPSPSGASFLSALLALILPNAQGVLHELDEEQQRTSSPRERSPARPSAQPLQAAVRNAACPGPPLPPSPSLPPSPGALSLMYPSPEVGGSVPLANGVPPSPGCSSRVVPTSARADVTSSIAVVPPCRPTVITHTRRLALQALRFVLDGPALEQDLYPYSACTRAESLTHSPLRCLSQWQMDRLTTTLAGAYIYFTNIGLACGVAHAADGTLTVVEASPGSVEIDAASGRFGSARSAGLSARAMSAASASRGASPVSSRPASPLPLWPSSVGSAGFPTRAPPCGVGAAAAAAAAAADGDSISTGLGDADSALLAAAAAAAASGLVCTPSPKFTHSSRDQLLAFGTAALDCLKRLLERDGGGPMGARRGGTADASPHRELRLPGVVRTRGHATPQAHVGAVATPAAGSACTPSSVEQSLWQTEVAAAVLTHVARLLSLLPDIAQELASLSAAATTSSLTVSAQADSPVAPGPAAPAAAPPGDPVQSASPANIGAGGTPRASAAVLASTTDYSIFSSSRPVSPWAYDAGAETPAAAITATSAASGTTAVSPAESNSPTSPTARHSAEEHARVAPAPSSAPAFASPARQHACWTAACMRAGALAAVLGTAHGVSSIAHADCSNNVMATVAIDALGFLRFVMRTPACRASAALRGRVLQTSSSLLPSVRRVLCTQGEVRRQLQQQQQQTRTAVSRSPSPQLSTQESARVCAETALRALLAFLNQVASELGWLLADSVEIPGSIDRARTSDSDSEPSSEDSVAQGRDGRGARGPSRVATPVSPSPGGSARSDSCERARYTPRLAGPLPASPPGGRTCTAATVEELCRQTSELLDRLHQFRIIEAAAEHLRYYVSESNDDYLTFYACTLFNENSIQQRLGGGGASGPRLTSPTYLFPSPAAWAGPATVPPSSPLAPQPPSAARLSVSGGETVHRGGLSATVAFTGATGSSRDACGGTDAAETRVSEQVVMATGGMLYFLEVLSSSPYVTWRQLHRLASLGLFNALGAIVAHCARFPLPDFAAAVRGLVALLSRQAPSPPSALPLARASAGRRAGGSGRASAIPFQVPVGTIRAATPASPRTLTSSSAAVGGRSSWQSQGTHPLSVLSALSGHLLRPLQTPAAATLSQLSRQLGASLSPAARPACDSLGASLPPSLPPLGQSSPPVFAGDSSVGRPRHRCRRVAAFELHGSGASTTDSTSSADANALSPVVLEQESPLVLPAAEVGTPRWPDSPSAMERRLPEVRALPTLLAAPSESRSVREVDGDDQDACDGRAGATSATDPTCGAASLSAHIRQTVVCTTVYGGTGDSSSWDTSVEDLSVDHVGRHLALESETHRGRTNSSDQRPRTVAAGESNGSDAQGRDALRQQQRLLPAVTPPPYVPVGTTRNAPRAPLAASIHHVDPYARQPAPPRPHTAAALAARVLDQATSARAFLEECERWPQQQQQQQQQPGGPAGTAGTSAVIVEDVFSGEPWRMPATPETVSDADEESRIRAMALRTVVGSLGDITAVRRGLDSYLDGLAKTEADKRTRTMVMLLKSLLATITHINEDSDDD